MTAASPWSVKGIDPKAREVAKDLARRSGMTLGEWLNQIIIEGEADAPPPYAQAPYASAPIEDDRRHGYRGIPARDYTPPGEPFRAPSPGSEIQRIARALEQLSARIEQAEHRSTLAISGIDQSVMGVLSRLEAVERDQGSVAARFDGSLEEVRQSQARVSEKVRRLSDDDAPRVEAMKALEGAVGKVAEKLYETETYARGAMNELREDSANLSRRVDRAEAKVESEPAAQLVDAVVARLAQRLDETDNRTTQAVRALETSFAGLDARLHIGEAEHDAADRRFERLATELSGRVEAARTEMAERLKSVAGGQLDKVEASLRDLAGHVEQSEQRSAQAIDRMGREVMRIASTFGERIGKVETRSAQAVEQVGGEMARIADAVEQRIGRHDAAQAQALEKLGGEIARIAEKLAERIASAERRSTQSIDDVGDQLGRVTERLNQRYDRAQSELADRIQQSEARTAKLLEDAQGKLDARLSETQRRASLEAAALAARQAAETEEAVETASPDYVAELAAPFGVAAAAETFSNDPFAGEPTRFAAAPVEPEPFVAPLPPTESFAPLAEEPFGALAPTVDAFSPEPVLAPAFEPEPPPSSTRAMLDQARAAVRQASEKSDLKGRRRTAEPPMGSVAAPPFEGDASKPFSFLPKRKKKDGVTLRTALVASGTAAALAVTGAGAVLLVNSEMSGVSSGSEHAEHFGVAPTAVAQDTTPVPAPPTAAPAQMAVALTPPPGVVEGLKTAETKPEAPSAPVLAAPAAETPLATATPSAATPKVDAAVVYSAAVRKIESGDPQGLPDLKKAANLGHPAAQFYLAKLYETGGAGLKKDLGEARRWTERAAGGGDVAAMHNLGLYYYEGEAGPQDSAKAAQWFQRAANQGVKDSQYNLALLYAKGYGVAQNNAEAYKWYLVAAASGDDGAKTAAQALRAQLTPEVQAASERAAAVFHAQALGAVRTASAASAQR